MIAVTALRLAGPGAVLAARPTGVLHVYVGALTPSGRFVPKSGRTACKAHTRRLGVVSHGATPANRRVCARCSTRLAGLPRPVGRDEWQARFAHVTLADLVAEVEHADTERWLDSLGHLALLVHGHKACTARLSDRKAMTFDQLLGLRRRTVNPVLDNVDARLRAHGETARSARKAERAEIHRLAEERKTRLGMNLAKPVLPKEPQK